MREIPLSRGLVALVDDTGYDRVVAAGRWHARPHGHTVYAQRHARLPGGRQTTQQLHVFLSGQPGIDHRNGNGLDNQRSNLRPATQSQNNWNARGRSGTSEFKGVSLYRRTSRWRAQIRHSGHSRHLGLFDTPEDAARAYDAAARQLFGEFARPNFPEVSV